MIISSNDKPPLSEFSNLVENATILLNEDAKKNSEHYLSCSPSNFEKDVERELKTAAIGTAFEDSIEIVSGRFFPDIVAKKYYGVEVKSTKSNKWTSIGSSVMESSRGEDIERIFLTFGKLSEPVKFISRPYEDCLSGAAVTHSPRYKIDMKLKKGETIFDLMNTTYDELRINNPEFEIINYYKSQMKDGERLWWSGGTSEDEALDVDELKIRLASVLTAQERQAITAEGLALFPEIHGNEQQKYAQFVLWLAAEHRVVSPSTRDFFSAGGKGTIETDAGTFVGMPQMVMKIFRMKDTICDVIESTSNEILSKTWNVESVENDRIGQWIDMICNRCESFGSYTSAEVLKAIFNRS